MPDTAGGATRTELIDFRVGIFRQHVDHVRTAQAMRFDVLRYTIIGLALYYSFLTSQATHRFLCEYPDIAVFWLPAFVLIQVFVYISLLNRNITKHGAFLKHLFREGLEPLGLGPNFYREFIQSYRASRLERLLERGHLHYSQLYVLVLIAGCAAIYLAVDIAVLARCRGGE